MADESAMAENSTNDEGQRERNEIRRRRLLKAAVGTGVVIAAHSAPKVSVVPAYGLSTSSKSDGKCYGLVWSSNNPTGKGWLSASETNSRLSGNIVDVTTGPAANAGNGTANYTWNIAGLGTFPASTLAITAKNCVNDGTATWTVSGLPTGYCLKFYNAGKPTKTLNTCGDTSYSGTGGVASPVTVQNNGTVTFTAQKASCTGSGQGVVGWIFNVVPCS